MKALQEVLERFERATGLSAIVWTQPVERGPLTVAAGSTSMPAPPIIEILTPGGPTAEVPFQGGSLVCGGVPGHPRAWLGVGPSDNGGRERAAAFHVAPSVAIARGASSRTSVVEVNALDRPGLLARLARAIHLQCLEVHSAHIATYGERAVDVFYLSTAKGRKLSDEHSDALRSALLAAATEAGEA